MHTVTKKADNRVIPNISVKSRMSSGDGISYGEFSYQLLQSFDFWHLYNTESCRLQVSASLSTFVEPSQPLDGHVITPETACRSVAAINGVISLPASI